MRASQDLCIALVLAVVGIGFGKPAPARTEVDEGLAVVEDAIAQSGLSDQEAASVRRLIALAQDRDRAGDTDGAASALAEASELLKIS